MKKILFLNFLLFSSMLFSQELSLDWSVCYGSASNDYPRAVEVLPNGNILVGVWGASSANPDLLNNYHGLQDIWILKLDTNGNLIDNKCFGGSENDFIYDLVMTDLGYFYILGRTASSDGDALSPPIGNSFGDIWILQVDYDLNLIWEKKLGPMGPTTIFSADATADGGLVVITDFWGEAGGTATEYYGYVDIWTFELDANGELLWEKTLGNYQDNNAGGIYRTSKNTTLILGETMYSGGMVDCECHGFPRDLWIVELDSVGEIIWQNCFGGSDWELNYDAVEDDNGYTILAVTTSNDGDVSGNHGNETADFWLFHIDNIGNMQWQKCIGGSDEDSPDELFITDDNEYVVIGNTSSNDGDISFNNGTNSSSDVWVVLLDSARNIIWEHTYGTSNNEYPTRNSIAQKGNMDYIISSQLKEYAIDDIEDCTPYPIDQGDANWVFRVNDPTVGSNVIDVEYKNLRVYPNPASDHVYIELQQNHMGAEIQILDVFGRDVTKLQVLPQQTMVLWELQNINSGVYFYQTQINGEIYRGKIVVN